MFIWIYGSLTNMDQQLTNNFSYSNYVGPKLPQKCLFGSMVPLLTDQSVIALIGCSNNFNGKIYRLSWNYRGNLVWNTMTQLLKYERYTAVAMVIPDEWTKCTIT